MKINIKKKKFRHDCFLVFLEIVKYNLWNIKFRKYVLKFKRFLKIISFIRLISFFINIKKKLFDYVWKAKISKTEDNF